MTQKQFFEIVDKGDWDKFIAVQLTEGFPCIPTYIHNFEFFMNEIKRSRRPGYRHIPFTYSFDHQMVYNMKAFYFYTQGTIKIIYPEGHIMLSQINNEARLVVF